MKRFIPLAGLCLAVFLVMTGMGMAIVALPEKYLRISGTMGASGWLAAMFAFAYMCCQYPAGRLADTVGFRPVLAAGCLLTAFAASLFCLAQTPFGIYAGRFIQGAGEAPIWASAPALLGRLYPDMKGRAMGLYNAAFHAGLMSGPALAMGLLGSGLVGQDTPFVIFAVLCLVAAGLVLLVPCGVPRAAGLAGSTGGSCLRDVRLWPIFCGVPVFGAAYGLLVSCLPVHLRAVAGLPQDRLGVLLFVAYAGIAAGQLGGGMLSDRFGRLPFLAGGIGLLGVALFCFAARPDTPMPVTFAGLGLGGGTFAVSSMALVSEASADARKGRACGLYFLAWGGGYFVGPLMANAFGLAPVAAGMGCAALLVACLQAWNARLMLRGRGQARSRLAE